MTKELLLQILELSHAECIPEKDAALMIIGKRMCLNKYKHKFGIELWEQGKSPMSRAPRKTKVNDNYFQSLTLESYYYAGFIAADGNINQNKNRLTITLSEKDKYFLEKFKSSIESDAVIHDYMIKNKHKVSSIVINSKQICDDLSKRFNITPNKSLTYNPPVILNNDQKDAFIIGIIDGDGTIGFSKRNDKQNSFYISLIGTYETIAFVKKRFEEIIGHEITKPFFRNKNINTCTIRISDKAARTVFQHFYSFNVPKLNRKWTDTFIEYCKSFKKRLPLCKRKGVNVFDLNGNLIQHFETLKEASEFCNVSISAISKIIKEDNSCHMANGYMFSRTQEKIDPYIAINPFSAKRLKELQLDNGIENIGDNV